MDNLNVVLLSGGHYRCTPEWNFDPFGRDNCYKLYFPVAGGARIFIDSRWTELSEGNAYFINGFVLDRQRCENMMEVYWLHFIPESQLFGMYLNNFPPVYRWERGNPLLESIDFGRIPFLFDKPNTRDNSLIDAASFSLTCYINSVVLMLISDMAGKQNLAFDEISYGVYFKLKPAIDYINGNYRQNLKLEDIAQKSFLNHIYFLRLFKKCFKITPGRYINMLRFNEACRLLMKTEMSILEISEQTGFCNQFYFSKAFKSHFHKTPMEYRKTKLSP